VLNAAQSPFLSVSEVVRYHKAQSSTTLECPALLHATLHGSTFRLLQLQTDNCIICKKYYNMFGLMLSFSILFIKMNICTNADRKSTLDLCFASPEEITEWQHPCCTTGNYRNHHCGDNSILRANVTWELGLPFLGAVGASVWGICLAGYQFLCAG